jgi:hypothetical protein
VSSIPFFMREAGFDPGIAAFGTGEVAEFDR